MLVTSRPLHKNHQFIRIIHMAERERKCRGGAGSIYIFICAFLAHGLLAGLGELTVGIVLGGYVLSGLGFLFH